MSKKYNHADTESLERRILKKIPGILLAGIFIPLFMVILARLYPIPGSGAEIASYQLNVDFLSISLSFLIFSTAFTVALGCVIIALMKAPAYVSDPTEFDHKGIPKAQNGIRKQLKNQEF